MQASLAHRLPGDILAVQVWLNRPARQSRHPSAARHQLENRHRQFGCSARGIDMGGSKDIAHQIQAFIGDRVSHEHLLLEILGREICFTDKWMAMREQCQNLIAKERMVDHPGTLRGMRNNDQIGAVFPKKPDRIGVKPGDQIELYLRPALAEGVHRWHQPVETRVTFHRDAKETGLALSDTCYVPLSIPNATADVVGKIHQVSARQREPERVALSFEELNAIFFFNCPHMVRNSRLRKIQPLPRFGQIPRLR